MDDIRSKIFENKFYVYEIIDPESGNVFYVGKGQKYRCFVHEYKTKNGKIPHNNYHLFNKISKILNLNKNLIYNIIFTSNDEDECYDFEEKTIEKYGIENLCNIELSNRGVKHTSQTIEKISKSNTGKKHSEETKEKLRKISTGKNHTDETIQKLRDKHKGKVISEEQREKIRNTLTKKRIIKIKNCENCESEFEVTIVENSLDRSKKCCSLSCSATLANKNRNK